MQEVIYFIIVIAILVFVHELGHFIAAKLTG
ncbi:MAG: site-2 protease family protein, partial [Ignavibacteriaceae bacterium]|nr:site-2 protease family protein [Ignavibacteriaceae bacterium]